MENQNTRARTELKRGRGRGINDLQTAFDIIDDNLMCHVAQIKNQFPVVTPTCHWRDGNRLYWHGHAKAHNVVGSKSQQICINISQLDGLVMARSAFHHSVNYRSITLFGEPQIVLDEEEKARQLQNFVNKVSPGRWDKLRPMNEKEQMITSVAWIPIDEYSIKVRAEGVNDDEADLDWPVWSGVLPIKPTFTSPLADSGDKYDVPEMPVLFKSKVYGA